MGSPPQFQYSVTEYLNQATVLLRYRTADVLPKWGRVSPNVRDVTGVAAKSLARIAQSTSELLVEKIELTGRLREETNSDAIWNIYNRMSGLRNQVRNQEAQGTPGNAHRNLTIAFELLTELDGKLTVLLDEAHQLKKVIQGVASQHLKDPVPENVAVLLNDMRAYNDSSKTTFWNLLDPNQSWNLDKARIDIINRLGPLGNDYPRASVLWARFLCPQVEAIEQEASTIALEVQLRKGTWQLIGNDLSNVARLLGEENEADRVSWYHDPFSIVANTQLRMMKEVRDLCAQ